MPLEKPFKDRADFGHFRKVIRRETTEGPVPFVELMVDVEILSEVTGREAPVASLFELAEMASDLGPREMERAIRLMDMSIEFTRAVGYDYVTMIPIVPLPRTPALRKEHPRQAGKIRSWQDEHHGLITTREDFQKFPWPSKDQISILPIEYAAERMPSGTQQMVFYNGIFEDLRTLMGFENMAIKSIEEPDLLADILERLTVLAEATVDRAAAHPSTGAVFYGEDMGFNQGTMLHPDFFREHVLPRHKRIVSACHRHDKLFLLHSCGKIEALMEDLIEEVGIDAFHSFQDKIMPIEEAHRRYGDRIAVLGGVDVDLLTRGTPGEVRKRTRQILEACAPTGGLAIGSGNSVTNYCKIENYYAMLDETRKWNQEHGH